MADSSGGGILGEIGNLAETLLPPVLGALGGSMGTPRLAGRGAALGRGLVGAGEGFLQGQQMRQQMIYQQMLAKHYQLQDQLEQQNLDANTILTKTWNALGSDDKKAYPTPQIYAQAMAHQAIQRIDAKGLRDTLALQFTTDAGRQRMARQGLTDPSQLPNDKAGLDMLAKQVAGPTAEQQAHLDLDRQRTADYEKHLTQEEQQGQERLGIERANEGIHAGEAAASEAASGMRIARDRAELAGTLPPRPEAADVQAKNKAETQLAKDRDKQLQAGGSSKPVDPDVAAKRHQDNIKALRDNYEHTLTTWGKHRYTAADLASYGLVRGIDSLTGQALPPLPPGWKYLPPKADGSLSAQSPDGRTHHLE